jgi:glycosyltransferase involved in cell wall biosynthesis
MRVAVIDMQVIAPPSGGGRQRLLGLYHDLGPVAATTYVGTYDWRDQPPRRQMLSPSLEEVLVPLSPAHFAAAEALSARLGGRTAIDTSFADLVHLSPDYFAAARQAARAADVVVLSHPWMWPAIEPVLQRGRQLLVYDAHNMEGLLRCELLDDGGEGTRLLYRVVAIERALCRAADLILTCSVEDADAFARLYRIPADRTRLAPNAAFASQITPPTPGEKQAVRAQFGLPAEPVAIFLGSDYGPNRDAARFIADRLAPALPRIRFVVAGGVGATLGGRLASNVVTTGRIGEADKRRWLHAADLALNPMFAGSGTNVKMLEYMAAGLPIVSTAIGARGLRGCAGAIEVAEADTFAATVAALAGAPERRASMGAAARRVLLRHYAWERISPAIGRLLARRLERRAAAPLFSVIVPSYERPDHLARLVALLARQSFRDFEVIVIDQSARPWTPPDVGIDLLYIHTDLRGAVAARNRGGALARGRVLAFTDDDCEPGAGWLAAAHAAFVDPAVVRFDDPAWRAVSNDGAEGIGFMTANLFVRAEAFHRLGGFDPDFEEPHFREDTEFGWRLQELGRVPFSRDASVFHPPHPRTSARESIAERSRFFEKDALLLRKHPKRYLALLKAEAQWNHNPLFWEELARGAAKYGVELPREVLSLRDSC